jgi:hypothetical protein
MRPFILRPENARQRMAAAWAHACEYLELGQAVRVEVSECRPTRSLDQNAMLHAICGDIAKQREWAGQKIDTEGWKRLLVDAWARHEGKSPGRVVPSLDGQSVVNLGIQTRSMRVGDMADLITFAQAWATEQGITLNEPRMGG